MRLRINGLGLATAAFLSGAAALFYETMWTRAFSIILGSTVYAASATFAAFIVGLGGGAWLGGRMARQKNWSLRAYAGLELLIALAAGAIGWWLHTQGDLLLPLLASKDSLAFYTFTSFSLVLVMTLPATLVMGATLPLLLQGCRWGESQRRLLGHFYFINTLGGAFGAALCGFFAIRIFGAMNSYFLAMGFNALSAGLAFAVALTATETEESPAESTSDLAAPRSNPVLGEITLLLLSFVSGFAVLAMEIVWTRLASFFVGNRVYAFTTLLSALLLILALGGKITEWLIRRYGVNARQLMPWLLSISALLGTVSLYLCDHWISRQLATEATFPAGDTLILFYRYLEALILMAPWLLPMAAIFPLAMSCTPRVQSEGAAAIGIYYLFNTAGCVLGSVFTGFIAVEWLGSFGWARAVLVGLAVISAIVAVVSIAGGLRRWGAALFAIGSIAIILKFTPTVLRAPIDADGTLVVHREDEYGVFQLVRNPDNTLKVLNNRTELIYHLGDRATSFVQQMQAHLPIFYRPGAQRVLVLGSGYGITAGAMGQYSGVREIDAVEILPEMVRSAGLFEPYNFSYHRNPKIKVHVDDGRHFLARSDKKYDIISVNVSDPHLPGGSALFHREFYTLAKKHLNPGGVIVQHAFGSDMQYVLATLSQSFRNLRLFPSYSNGYNVIASDDDLTINEPAVLRLTSDIVVKSALEEIGFRPPIHPLPYLAKALALEMPEGGIEEQYLATDDRPRIEFAWAKNPADRLFSNE